MTPPTTGPLIGGKIMTATSRRVVIALDHLRRSPVALDHAVRLADLLNAQVAALYIEDQRLFDLARLPFTQEVNRTSGAVKNLESRELLREMAVQTQAVRRQLAQTVGPRQIEINVQVIRGRFASAVLNASTEQDVVYLNVPDRQLDTRLRQHLAAQAKPATSLGPVQVIMDDSPASIRALILAKEACALAGAELVVVLRAELEPDAGLIAQVEQTVAGSGVVLRFLEMPVAACAGYLADLAAADCSLMVVPVDHPVFDQPDIAETLDGVAFPIALVR